MIHIDLPESVLLTTGQSQEAFVKEAKFLLALKLFELGRRSSLRGTSMFPPCGALALDEEEDDRSPKESPLAGGLPSGHRYRGEHPVPCGGAGCVHEGRPKDIQNGFFAQPCSSTLAPGLAATVGAVGIPAPVDGTSRRGGLTPPSRPVPPGGRGGVPVESIPARAVHVAIVLVSARGTTTGASSAEDGRSTVYVLLAGNRARPDFVCLLGIAEEDRSDPSQTMTAR
jgi:hypothetical protein